MVKVIKVCLFEAAAPNRFRGGENVEFLLARAEVNQHFKDHSRHRVRLDSIVHVELFRGYCLDNATQSVYSR